jgi:hypothetical protein
MVSVKDADISTIYILGVFWSPKYHMKVFLAGKAMPTCRIFWVSPSVLCSSFRTSCLVSRTTRSHDCVWMLDSCVWWAEPE